MSRLDLSLMAIKTAVVVVKEIWRAFGETPLVVQLAGTDDAYAWELEARRYLSVRAKVQHRGERFDVRKYVAGQVRPATWDEEYVGERPGMDDPILYTELPKYDAFYVAGPIRFVRDKIK